MLRSSSLRRRVEAPNEARHVDVRPADFLDQAAAREGWDEGERERCRSVCEALAGAVTELRFRPGRPAFLAAKAGRAYVDETVVLDPWATKSTLDALLRLAEKLLPPGD